MFAAMSGRHGIPVQGNGIMQFRSREDFHRNGSSGNRNGSSGRRPSGGTSGEHPGRDGHTRVRFTEEEGGKSILSGTLDFLVFAFTTSLAAVCVAGLMTILVVLYVTVRPFSQPVYRRLVAQLGGASFLDAFALLLPNTKIFLTGDSDIPSPVGTSVLVSNHVIDADWWGMLMLGRCVGLRGTLKIFLRNEYLHINMDNSNPCWRSSSALTTSSSSPRILMDTTSTRSESTGSRPRSESGNSSPPSSSASVRRFASYDVTVLAKLLHSFLEFPLINGEDYASDREHLFQLLRSFVKDNGSSAPVHLLLYPEGWSLHNGADRLSIHAKSNEFAKREGRPQLKHLLLPRNRGFKASLECLRESSPVVYDVTMVCIRRSTFCM
jgi:hypothetical protein